MAEVSFLIMQYCSGLPVCELQILTTYSAAALGTGGEACLQSALGWQDLLPPGEMLMGSILEPH